MSLNSELWDDIKSTLTSISSSNLSAASAGYDLYEAYIWAMVIDAAKNEGAVVDFKDRHGNSPTDFYFRTSPSSIHSTAHDYCHAEISFHDCEPLEAHVGIFVAGRSQVLHECDVAVLQKREAEICRQSSVDPRSGKLVLAAECKYYLKSSIGINLGRSFMGLVSDIYKGDRFFVGTKDSPSVAKMLTNHKKDYELGLSPLAPRLEVRLKSAFETTFRNYCVSQR